MTHRVLALLFLWGPASAGAYVHSTTSTGKALFWPRDQVDFEIANGGAVTLPAGDRGLEFPAIRRAFLTWEEVAGSRLRFGYRGRVADDGLPNDGDGIAGVRFFRSNVPPELSDAIGVTVITFDDSLGRIFDADLSFNERDYRFSVTPSRSTIDLESVVLHEVGHLVGLDHTCGVAGESQPSCYSPTLPQDPRYHEILGAVMYPLRGAGDPVLRTLTPDDAAGVAATYPASPPVPAPRITAVSVLAAGGGGDLTAIAVEGSDFDPAVTVQLLLDGAGNPAVDTTLSEQAPARVVATADLRALPPGCYDVLAQNPSGKHGASFGALPVGGVSCAQLSPRTGGGGGCAQGGAATGGWGLTAVALAWAWGHLRSRRRRLAA